MSVISEKNLMHINFRSYELTWKDWFTLNKKEYKTKPYLIDLISFGVNALNNFQAKKIDELDFARVTYAYCVVMHRMKDNLDGIERLSTLVNRTKELQSVLDEVANKIFSDNQRSIEEDKINWTKIAKAAAPIALALLGLYVGYRSCGSDERDLPEIEASTLPIIAHNPSAEVQNNFLMTPSWIPEWAPIFIEPHVHAELPEIPLPTIPLPGENDVS